MVGPQQQTVFLQSLHTHNIRGGGGDAAVRILTQQGSRQIRKACYCLCLHAPKVCLNLQCSPLSTVKYGEEQQFSSFCDTTVMIGSRSRHDGKMMQMPTSQGLLINDIVFEEDDWSIMGATSFTQLHKAWQYIFTCSTCCSIVVHDYQGLWMRLLY